MDTFDWLLTSNEPWTRYRTRLDLLGQDPNSRQVLEDRAELLTDPKITDLISRVLGWPAYPLKRHNDAKHPLQALTVLADFGLNHTDAGLNEVIQKVSTRQSAEGAFLTQLELYGKFSKVDGEIWSWMGCDAPVLLYILTAFGFEDDRSLEKAKDHLFSLASETGWPCTGSENLGNFRGPGKKGDPCPIATLQALKALTLDPALCLDPRVESGAKMLLHHWEIQTEKKYYLFGIGSDFKRLKYPFIWYDLLHVVDVLSRISSVHDDPRFKEMVGTILGQADREGRYTANSMYMAWKDWSFANKKQPSPWLTFLVKRIQKRTAL